MNLRMLSSLACIYPALLALPVLALTLLPTCTAAQHAAGEPASLEVKGEAIVSAVPEIMVASIPIEVRAQSYTTCHSLLMETYNDLRKALVKAGISEKNIKSVGLSVREEYGYHEGKRISQGYVGNIATTIESPFTRENLGKLTSTLNEDPFDFGYQVSFQLSEAQKEQLTSEAIKKAVADAQQKAKLLAESAGVTIIAISQIVYDPEQNYSIPLTSSFALKTADQESTTPDLNPEELELNRVVRISYRIDSGQR